MFRTHKLASACAVTSGTVSPRAIECTNATPAAKPVMAADRRIPRSPQSMVGGTGFGTFGAGPTGAQRPPGAAGLQGPIGSTDATGMVNKREMNSVAVTARSSPGEIDMGTYLVRCVFGAVLFVSMTAAHAEWSARSISSICAPAVGGTCDYDFRSGSTAQSSIGRAFEYVDSSNGGGYKYTAFASGTGSPNSFSLFADAGGNSTENVSLDIAYSGVQANSVVFHMDEVNISGSGNGTIVLPWHIVGTFDIRAQGSTDSYKPSATFGIPFCQSIPVGAQIGGVGCSGGGTQTFENSSNYDMLVQLVFPVQFGVPTALNTHFELHVLSGAGLASGATADFSHTGLLQPVSVYDSNGFLLPDAVILAASGLDYHNPQGVSAVPEPSTAVLLLIGVLGLGLLRRPRTT